MSDLFELLRCPRCAGRLREVETEIACADCDRRYPRVAGIPLLVGDPHEERRQWRHRLHEFGAEIDHTCDRLLAQIAGEDVPARARARMQRLRDGLPSHRDAIVELFAAAGIEPAAQTIETRHHVPGEGTVTAYYDQTLRDWDWGSDEIEAALGAIEGVWPDGASLGRCLVLGSGAGRLPWELARRLGATVMVALDLNPLPYLVVQRLASGAEVTLYELPQQPRRSTDVIAPRTLRAPSPPVELSLVFADGLHPPVAPGAFDTVVTPWFIDQVPPDFAELLGPIAAALRIGGRWLNHGPLIYHPNHTRLAHRYRVDEVLEIVTDAGLRLEASAYAPLPYMHSPASSQGRTEWVLSFVARKTADAAGRARRDAEPSWLTHHDEPVPRLAGLDAYRPPHPMFAAVIALVDGRRSIAEIATEMVRRHGLPESAAAVGVQGCLTQIVRALDDAP